jgi:threonine aldolase
MSAFKIFTTLGVLVVLYLAWVTYVLRKSEKEISRDSQETKALVDKLMQLASSKGIVYGELTLNEIMNYCERVNIGWHLDIRFLNNCLKEKERNLWLYSETDNKQNQ